MFLNTLTNNFPFGSSEKDATCVDEGQWGRLIWLIMIHNSCPSRCFCTPQQLSPTGRDEEQSKTQENICLLVLKHWVG